MKKSAISVTIASMFLLLLWACKKVYTVPVVNRHNYIQEPASNKVGIAWRTADTIVGKLRWGTSSNNLNLVWESREPQQKHYAILQGLQPNTTYYYQTNAVSHQQQEINSFTTAPKKGQTGFSFLHYGDCGTGRPIQKTVASQMENEEEIDFALVTGDVDQGKGYNYDAVFFQPYREMLKNTCHFTSIGNHDVWKTKGMVYIDAFHLPHNNPDSSERYYSFVWGNAKFICLDSNIKFGNPKGEGVESDQQLKWLEQELEEIEQDWTFVYFHHPPYTSAWSPDYGIAFGTQFFHYKGTREVRERWLPLFEGKVDFVLNGHSHCYQRGELKGIHHIISGGSGTSDLKGKHSFDKVRMNRSMETGQRIPKWKKKPFDYQVNGKKVEHAYNVDSIVPTIDLLIRQSQYVRFDVEKTTVTFKAINEQGQTIDSVVVRK